MGDDKAIESRGVLAVGKLGSSFGELRNTSDASVFLVQLGGDDLLFGSTDGRQDVGLALVVTVGTNTWSTVVLETTESKLHVTTRGVGDLPRLIFLSNESALKASVIPTDMSLDRADVQRVLFMRVVRYSREWWCFGRARENGLDRIRAYLEWPAGRLS